MGSLQQICLRWNNHQSNFPKVFDELRQSKDLVDVTLTCDGQAIDAHKVILSACSPYFRNLFQNNPCQHPIIFMRDVKYSELDAMVEFMYKGEVNVAREELTDFLRTAQSLQVKGLAEDKNGEKTENGTTPKAQQNALQMRPLTIPGLPQITLNNISNNSNNAHQPSAKTMRLMPSNNSVSSTTNAKLSVTPHSTPPHPLGSQSPQRATIRKVDDSRQMRMEEDLEDDESNETSGDDQQGLDMLMESTLETGDDSYVDDSYRDDRRMYSDDKSALDSSLQHGGASTSGVPNQLMQTEGLLGLLSRGRSANWSDWEEEELINIWCDKELQKVLKANHRAQPIYDAISEILYQRGVDRTSAQCKLKLKKLKMEMKAIVKSSGHEGLGRKKPHLAKLYRLQGDKVKTSDGEV